MSNVVVCFPAKLIENSPHRASNIFNKTPCLVIINRGAIQLTYAVSMRRSKKRHIEFMTIKKVPETKSPLSIRTIFKLPISTFVEKNPSRRDLPASQRQRGHMCLGVVSIVIILHTCIYEIFRITTGGGVQAAHPEFGQLHHRLRRCWTQCAIRASNQTQVQRGTINDQGA